MTKIPARKVVAVRFDGFDGKTYDGWSYGINNGIAKVSYKVATRAGMLPTTAYIDIAAEGHRLHRRNGVRHAAK